MPELKSCPFCGYDCAIGTVRFPNTEVAKLNERDEGYYVQCIRCEAENNGGAGIGFATKEEAIEHWNRRSTPLPSEEEIECQAHMTRDSVGGIAGFLACADWLRERLGV